MSVSPSKVKKQLQSIIANERNSLRAAVAEETLHYDRIDSFFNDLFQHGCRSGMVSSLIYYTDTHKFFDIHYDEIETMRYELEEMFGSPLQPKGDLKNWYAWMAFEETARMLAEDLDLL